MAAAEPELDEEAKVAIAAKMAEAEALGEEGEVDEAQRKLEEVEAIKRLAAVRAAPSRAVLERERDQKLRVCDICGAFLSIYDRCVHSTPSHRCSSAPASIGIPPVSGFRHALSTEVTQARSLLTSHRSRNLLPVSLYTPVLWRLSTSTPSRQRCWLLPDGSADGTLRCVAQRPPVGGPLWWQDASGLHAHP